MTVKIILNPYANRWGARAKVAAVKAALEACHIPFDLTITEGPGDGIEIARDAANFGYESVVAVGGDGTISEVVNGLIAAAPDDAPTVPLGIIPIGTANDFSDMVKIPRTLLAAAEIIARGRTCQVDAGRLTVTRNEYHYSHYFNNNCAVAMEPMVTLEHIKMTRLSGEIRYFVALLRALVRLKAWQMRISWDDGEYEGPTFLLSVCNSPRTGGFYMAPEARTDDGLLDFVLAPEMGKRTVLVVLARLLRGTHTQHPLVRSGKTKGLRIESHPGTPIHADGEIVAESETKLAYQILPGKITLLTA